MSVLRRLAGSSRPVRRITLASAALLLSLVAAAPASATAPSLAITAPAPGTATSESTPLIVGTLELAASEEIQEPIMVTVYQGPLVTGKVVGHAEYRPFGTGWSVRLTEALTDGTYTVEASAQPTGAGASPLLSAPVTFREDKTAPRVAILAPAAGAAVSDAPLTVSGSAGTETGDAPSVTVDLYAGGAVAGNPIEGLELTGDPSGAWSGTLAALAPGAYTLQAVQSDSAGNVGRSLPASFIVLPPPPAPPPPKASFSWFPVSPQAGEAVTFVSSSTDANSPLTTFAWSLGSAGPFHAAGPTLETTFASSGPHVVRLAVADALGQSNVATETIDVRDVAATLMQPFPIVRIAGRLTRRGVRLSLLTVTAPVSARVTVRVRGFGIKSTSLSRVATAASPAGSSTTALMSFPHFARTLPAGAVLEVSVTKAGEIGKLTRFAPRRHRLPTRTDTCLTAEGAPLRCPLS